jgi:hypothetical protein
MSYPLSPTIGTDTQSQIDRLIGVCRSLTDHLSAYAISAETFDEDSFISCERAERLLSELRPTRRQLASPRGQPATAF